MDKIKFILNLLGFLILFSCTEKTNRDKQAQGIIEDNKKIDLNSGWKRYDQDIIQRLFDSEVNKNQQLKIINEKIEKIENLKVDSLIDYNRYIKNNEDYWSTVDRYLVQINDTILKREISKVYKDFKKRYEDNISLHKKMILQIVSKEKELNDNIILLKLIISHKIMINYQKEALPKADKINNIVEDYDSLIKDIKNYNKLKE